MKSAVVAGVGAEQPRDDDPLSDVLVPVSKGSNPARTRTSHPDAAYNSLVAANLIPSM
ncbi:hypothetical protein ACH433_09080 [Streptomyces olivaceoviridis]|uniref:hypothetical protein n=1 Tax=Streptomyces olivaceoviridis TaxID=1921 RepID=UPI0037AD2349